MVKLLVEQIESQYHAFQTELGSAQEIKEEKFSLESPTKQAILDNYNKYPVYFSEAIWNEDNSQLSLTRSSLRLEYSGAYPTYFRALEQALVGTQIEMDVITTINRRDQYFSAKYI